MQSTWAGAGEYGERNPVSIHYTRVRSQSSRLQRVSHEFGLLELPASEIVRDGRNRRVPMPPANRSIFKRYGGPRVVANFGRSGSVGFSVDCKRVADGMASWSFFRGRPKLELNYWPKLFFLGREHSTDPIVGSAPRELDERRCGEPNRFPFERTRLDAGSRRNRAVFQAVVRKET